MESLVSNEVEGQLRKWALSQGMALDNKGGGRKEPRKVKSQWVRVKTAQSYSLVFKVYIHSHPMVTHLQTQKVV